jgi:flagellar protein FlgJ
MDSLGFLRAPSMPLGPDPLAAAKDSRRGDANAIRAVATNFESMFLAQVLKEMRQTLEPGGLFGQDSADVQGGLFDLFLGQHLAQAGGCGLAAMIQQQLEASTPHETPPPSPKPAPRS